MRLSLNSWQGALNLSKAFSSLGESFLALLLRFINGTSKKKFHANHESLLSFWMFEDLMIIFLYISDSPVCLWSVIVDKISFCFFNKSLLGHVYLWCQLCCWFYLLINWRICCRKLCHRMRSCRSTLSSRSSVWHSTAWSPRIRRVLLIAKNT